MGVIDANSDSKYLLPTTGHVFDRRCGQQLFVLIRLCFESLIKRNTQKFKERNLRFRPRIYEFFKSFRNEELWAHIELKVHQNVCSSLFYSETRSLI
jgi:hypothetical protein